jgi:8-oxo-dGTP pyrophosphatase MutT (NUDIX family)
MARPFVNHDAITGDGTHDERREAHAEQGRSVRPAAVLIVLFEQADGLNVVLTQRTAHLRDHAGQISFPGGRKDEGDADLIATALREAQEEIGLNPGEVEIIGTLPRYVTITAYEITPVLAICAPQVFVPDPFEVAEAFTVPLTHFLAEENWRRDSMMREGVRRDFWAVPYAAASGERYIWGATAGMLRVLAGHLWKPSAEM